MTYKFDTKNGHVIGAKGKPIGVFMSDAYVDIRRGGRYIGKAHRMIWESVHGTIPYGMQINHRNGIKWDNRLENLELVTPSQNTLHAYDMGLKVARGERNGRAIITMEIAEKIRALRGMMSYKRLGEMFGISDSTVCDICKGRKWVNHVRV